MELRQNLFFAAVALMGGAIAYYFSYPVQELRSGPTVVIERSTRYDILVIGINNYSPTPISRMRIAIHCEVERCFLPLDDGQWVSRPVGRFTIVDRHVTNERQIVLSTTIPAESRVEFLVRPKPGAPYPVLNFSADANLVTPVQRTSGSLSGLILRHYWTVVTVGPVIIFIVVIILGYLVFRRPSPAGGAPPAHPPELLPPTPTPSVPVASQSKVEPKDEPNAPQSVQGNSLPDPEHPDVGSTEQRPRHGTD